MRKVIIVLAALIVTAGIPALAFHDAGVADCQGCHTMHNSEDGALVDANSPNGNAYLLVDATPSDVCLGCHIARQGQVLAADPLVPGNEYGGGDFVFITEDNVNDGHGGASSFVSGDAAGHNINAPGYGVANDMTLSAAPGGTFPAGALGCSSCHDPHGNQNFRLLYGPAQVQDGLYTFTNAAPLAVGISINGAAEDQANHTAYNGGMSAWCANCHGDFHQQNGGSDLIHPSGQTLGGGVAQTYNLYNGTVDQTGGVAATAYLTQVPFEDASMTTTSTAGPTAASMVSCITCHRAHATSAKDAGRWDFQVTYMHEDGDESGSFDMSTLLPAPYSDLNQRSLCNKCHNKDVGDEMPF